MQDREVRVGCVVAYALWTAMVALLCVSVVTRDWVWGVLGLACSAAAAVAHIRCYFVASNSIMRSAFELGREADRLRSVN